MVVKSYEFDNTRLFLVLKQQQERMKRAEQRGRRLGWIALVLVLATLITYLVK